MQIGIGWRQKQGNWSQRGTLRPGVWSPLSLAAFAPALLPVAASAENHVDYRYESYREEGGRIQVQTHSVAFEQKLADKLAARGELTYDGISGATPNGSPPQGTSLLVPLTPMKDIRRAGDIALDWRWGRQLLSPQVSYSEESDYRSLGIALNDAIDFNDKNTTLRFGVSHNFDRVLDLPEDARTPRAWHDKASTEGLIGISQLLDPKTVFTADFTYGDESGFLNDPYRRVLFRDWLTLFPGTPLYITRSEVRPSERSKQVFQTTLTHFFESLNGSAEVAYRFHHDSYDVFSHTATLTWHQHLGAHVLLEPMFRFYEQSAASFYYPLGVPGLSPADGNPDRPRYYSADYRLAHMYTLTYGVQATVIIKDWLHLNVGYNRYEMNGLDHTTSASAFPKANIITAGLRIWF